MASSTTEDDFSYMRERYEDQLRYFEAKAKANQNAYWFTRRLMLIANLVTPILIFVQVILPASWGNVWSFVPMIVSTVAFGCYQWEETHNYGTQWSKFRLVVETMKRYRWLFETGTMPFNIEDPVRRRQYFVEVIEKLIEGTDVNYFTLMIDPQKNVLEGK
jgi:hypothetical protein